jgi:hypothetical protein
MHSNDIKDRFAELRAKGLSLSRIASGIRVSQRTLVEWNRQLAPDIRALRAVHLEALHEQTLASRETDLARLGIGTRVAHHAAFSPLAVAPEIR